LALVLAKLEDAKRSGSGGGMRRIRGYKIGKFFIHLAPLSPLVDLKGGGGLLLEKSVLKVRILIWEGEFNNRVWGRTDANLAVTTWRVTRPYRKT